jgi:hypothetical protein
MNPSSMIGPDGIRAVLDWELCHLGIPSRTSLTYVRGPGGLVAPDVGSRWTDERRPALFSAPCRVAQPRFCEEEGHDGRHSRAAP